MSPRDRDEVKEIVQEAEEIKEDPEAWAQEEEDSTLPMTAGPRKTASGRQAQVTRSIRFIRAAANSGHLSPEQMQRLAHDLASIEQTLMEQP